MWYIIVITTGQATLLNLLLRNFLEDNLYDQAQKLVSKTVFPENSPNTEAARYLYYIGRIKAIQLDYSEARMTLELAIRKAPKGAVGFLQTANKLFIIVQMLLGEIPERDLFRVPHLRRSLIPYFQLTQAVRAGNLGSFNDVISEHGQIFRRDKNFTLILRLRHNVIKTGVKMVNMSYSRVSLADVANKLQLDSTEDTEYIVAKAIRDGVVDATIDHKDSYVSSKETTDIYSTQQPHEAFHQRIEFCLKMHNDLVKAMRYPPNAYRKYLNTGDREHEDLVDAIEIVEEDDEL
jgi:26S proteasome regulatory subunit N3